MLRYMPKQTSFHSSLYNKIPKNHILKQINSVVDFSFINELLEDSYCKEFGRPAKEPEMMCKLLMLQHLYNLSDERVIEEANLNLAYMYFLKINPEDTLPDKSLLSKFRTQRLKETSLDEVLKGMVKQCVEKGIIEGNGASIDTTHTEANTKKKTPERLMKELSKKIINTYEEESNEVLEKMPEIPNYKEIKDVHEAKEIMKKYLEEVMNTVEKKASFLDRTKTKTRETIKKAKEILKDPKFIAQKGIRSLVDEDARVGHKSKTKNFYGYKTEIVMTSDERIITALKVGDGSYVDGTYTKELLDRTKEAGIKLKEVYADKAYFRKEILDTVKQLNAKAYIPVSQTVYRIDESEFSYNKDSDQWQCSQGNISVKKKYAQTYRKNKTTKKKSIQKLYKYYFEINQCKACPKHDQCAKTRARKILRIGLNTKEFYEISQYQKTKEFIEKYKKRASIEGKNAEIKRFHGLDKARGYGLVSVSIQSKLTAIAVNIKRISGIISSLFDIYILFLRIQARFFIFSKYSLI